MNYYKIKDVDDILHNLILVVDWSNAQYRWIDENRWFLFSTCLEGNKKHIKEKYDEITEEDVFLEML